VLRKLITNITLIIVVAVLLQSRAALQASIITCSLSSPEISGVFSGGEWGPNEDGFLIEWTVYQNPDQSWHYKYEIFKENGDPLRKLISHFTFSLSDNIAEDDLYNFGSDIDEVTFGTFDGEQGSSDPCFPEGKTIFGVKFDMIDENQGVAEFDSTRLPMWGDFYSKGGMSSGGWNYAYNVDIGVEVANLHNYTVTPVDDAGAVLSKILVPNTIPEPATMALVGLGGLSFIRRKRRT